MHLPAALHITAGQMHALTGSVTVPTENVLHVGGKFAIVVALLMQVVQPDVVLVTYDALTSDISQLQPIEWEAIVVDERNRIQPSLSKAHQALRELEANFKLLLASGNPTKVGFSESVKHMKMLPCFLQLQKMARQSAASLCIRD